jgi:hypothetical protein
VLARSYLEKLEAALKANFKVRAALTYKRKIGAQSLINLGQSLVLILDSEMGLATTGEGAVKTLLSEPQIPGVIALTIPKRARLQLDQANFLSEATTSGQLGIFRSMAETIVTLGGEAANKWKVVSLNRV